MRLSECGRHTMTPDNPFNLRNRVWQNPDNLATELSGEAVLMSLDTGRYYGMRSVAGRIWQLLAKPQTGESLCRALEQEFDVPRDRCEREVSAFLAHLAREGLIRVASADD